MSAERLAVILILAGGSLWGIIGLFSSGLASSGCSPVEITFIRNLVGSLGMVCFLMVRDKNKLKIAPGDLWMFLGTGILSIVFFNIMYFWTIELTTLSVAAVLLYTAPCFVMIMSVVFFHENLTRRKILALVLAFLGCAFTTGIMDLFTGAAYAAGIKGIGIVTGIASGFGYALYSIFGNVALKKYSSETVTAYTFLVAAIFLAPFCLRPAFLAHLSQPSVLGNGLAIGIFSTLAPFLLYTAGLKHVPPGKASVMAFVEPMVATLVSVFILKESMRVAGMLGIVMIFGSIVILNTGREE